MDKSKPNLHYAWLIAIGCCFMNAGGLGAILDAGGAFYPHIIEETGWLRGDLLIYLSFYFVTTVVAMPIVGWALEKFNIRVVLSVAMIITCLGLAAMGIYQEVWQYRISGVIFGFFGSFIFVVPAPILILNWFKKRKGIVLGVTMCFSGVGGAILAPVFTLLINHFGWRMSYFIAAIIIAIMVLPFTLFVFRLRPADMGLKPYGWTEEDEAVEQARLAESRLSVADDGKSGGKISYPGVPFKRGILSIQFVCMFLLCGLIAYFAGFNSNMVLIGTSFGFESLAASGILSAVMAGNMFDKLFMGYLNDKIGVNLTFFLQCGMVFFGFICFLFLQHWVYGIYLAGFLFGAQNSLYSVSTPLLIRRFFGEKDYTKLFTCARIGTGVIGLFGPPTIGYIRDFTGNYDGAFIVGIGCILGCVLTVAIAELTRKRRVWDK
jgi:MFS family permease